MGQVRADIELINASDISFVEAGMMQLSEIRRIAVSALVDTGAVMLAINETIQAQLGLKTRDRRPAQRADGSIVEHDVVGPIEVRFKNRYSTTNALVLPGNQEVLLGAIPMEEMDVLIHPAKEELIINPAHPLKAKMILKAVIPFSFLVLTALAGQAQTVSKRMTVKVYETHPNIMNAAPIIKITHEDNRVETIRSMEPPSRDVTDGTANQRKVNEVLDLIKAKGYKIKTTNESTLSPNDFVSVITYEFEEE
jgi:clan AA aspartic protease